MSDTPRSFFAASRLVLIPTLVLLFGLGFGVRLIDATDLPLDFHPTRQLLSALKARGMYYQTAPDVPDWQREMSLQQWKTKAEVEPEVLEGLVAFTYRLTGEQLWVARVYSSLFWSIGGIFLFLLIRNLVSLDGAVIASAYYLFLPYAVIASRSFQPDPLMVMLILIFWWAVERWGRSESWPAALLAGLAGGFAIFIKFVAAFFVVGAALGFVLGRFDVRRLLRQPQVWVMAALGLLPSAVYIFFGVVLHGFLGRQFSGRFIPALLLSPANYMAWAVNANMAAGGVAIMLGLSGLFFVRERSIRSFLFGLWGAYLVFGLVFDYHIATHDYYHLPLIPIVAVSLAPLADAFLARLADLAATRRLRLAVLGILLYGLLSGVGVVRNQMKSIDYRPQAALWVEIGDRLEHGKHVIALTQDYGSRLAYWGWQTAESWPNSGDVDYHTARGASYKFDEMFARLTQNKHYFLVTDFDELSRQPDLKARLAGFSVSAQGEGYVIYDLSQPLK